MDPSGGQIGPYRIKSVLGKGGMAVVYLGEDERDGREVAVKVLARMRPTWVQRFTREFDAARRVNHPNVVRVLEAGESGGMAYFSMELVHGVTTTRFVHHIKQGQPLPPPPPMERQGDAEPIDIDQLRRCLNVGIQLCRAVGAIHSVGLVHRDLKPGNVLMTEDGTLKLVDFGVAKWLEEQSTFTQVGHVVGSYSYMSPEQITGAEVDHRADIYGMGVLLYELLSGAPPFRARRPQEFLWLHCTAQPDPLSRWLTGVPPALDALLLRMLAKEAADRPENTRLVEERLLAIQRSLDDELLEEDSWLEPSGPQAMSEGSSVVHMGFLADDDETLRTMVSRLPGAAPRDEEVSAPTQRLSAEERARIVLRAQQGSADDAEGSTESDAEVPRSESRPQDSGATRSRSRRKSGGSSSSLAALVNPRYVGRKPELEDLLTDLKKVRKRGVRAVVIEGEEGMGKTRLLQTFRGLAWVKGARVSIGRCHASGGALCAPFHDIMLRIAGPGLPRSHVQKVLGPDRDKLVRFFPALGRGPEDFQAVARPGSEGLSAPEDPAPVFRAVGQALRRTSQETPLVIGVEDLQWGDEGTFRLITTLLRRLSPPNRAPVLLVLTYRPTDAGGVPGLQHLPSILDLPNVRQAQLPPLSVKDLEEVVRSVVVSTPIPEDLVKRTAEAAAGNPRFAVEVARTLIEEGNTLHTGEELPTSLVAAYRKRLLTLSGRSRLLAQCIALMGGRPPLSVVQHACGLPEDEFSRGMQELERRRVTELDTRGERDTVALHSEALCTAVLDSLKPRKTRALHRQAAIAWLLAGNGLPGAAAQTARHFYAAGESRTAFPHALTAAWQAREATDLTAMRRWMEQIGDPGDALDQVSTSAVYRFQMLRFSLGFYDGDLDEAKSALAAAVGAASEDRERLDTGVATARVHIRQGSYYEAVQVARSGLREAHELILPDLAAVFALVGASAAHRSGDSDSALAWLAEVDLVLPEIAEGDEIAVEAAWRRSSVLMELRREGEAETEAHRAIAMADRSHQEQAEARLRLTLATLAERRGDVPTAVEHTERALRIFEDMDLLDHLADTQSALAKLRLLQGRLDDAAQLAEDAWTTTRRLRDRRGTIRAGSARLAVARARQDAELAADVIDKVGDGPAQGQILEAVWLEYWLERARWHRCQGQKTLAWHGLQQAARVVGTAGAAYRRREVELQKAALLAARGEYSRAMPLLEQVITEAEDEMHWPVAWRGRVMIDHCAVQLGDPVEISEVPGDVLLHNVPLALAVAWYRGGALRVVGRDTEARIVLEEGRDLARDKGFKDWVQRFDELQ